MTPRELEAYLHAHIPISAEMGVRVTEAGAGGVILAAPLAPNINHRSTAFGGSVSAVAILAGWAWLHVMLCDAGLKSRLVIQRNSVEYLAPITGEFEARYGGLAESAREKFLRTFRRLGKARATVAVEVACNGSVAATFEGHYVALRLGGHQSPT